MANYRTSTKPLASFDATNLTFETPRKEVAIDTIEAEERKEPTASKQNAFALPIRPIGQAFGTYLLAEYGDNLLLVDQHAAAERVLYDRLVGEYTTGNVSVQPLLLPYEFELSELDAIAMEDRIDVLDSIGVEIEALGQSRFAINAIPAILSNMDMDAFVRLLLDQQPSNSAELFKEKLAYAACRAAIKGNTYLDEDAIKMLLNDLFSNGLPGQCPHGRPAYVMLSKTDLEKMFRRKV